MGKLDWNSPEFVLLEHLSENPEPLGYAAAVIGDIDRARVWVRRLVMARLLELHHQPEHRQSEHAALSSGDAEQAIWDETNWWPPYPGTFIIKLSHAGLDALQRRDISAFERF